MKINKIFILFLSLLILGLIINNLAKSTPTKASSSKTYSMVFNIGEINPAIKSYFFCIYQGDDKFKIWSIKKNNLENNNYKIDGFKKNTKYIVIIISQSFNNKNNVFPDVKIFYKDNSGYSFIENITLKMFYREILPPPKKSKKVMI